MTEKPFMLKSDMLDWLLREGIEPPRLYKLGFPHNNCFSASIPIVTWEGIKPIGDLVGRSVRVIGRGGKWREAKVCSFGEQELWALTVKRHRCTMTFEVTADHLWFRWKGQRGHKVREIITTSSLQPDDRLKSMFPPTMPHTVRPSPFGIAHGIVYGDGVAPRYYDRPNWIPLRSESPQSGPARIMLCGAKSTELLKWFPKSVTRAASVGVEVQDLPRTWKSLPDRGESRSYLYGWLAGYFAADGSVSKDGEPRLSSADRTSLEFAEMVATRCGFVTFGITTESRYGFGENASDLHTLKFVKGTLPHAFFLISEHYRRGASERDKQVADWRVVSVEPLGRTEEVFCAVVPNGHAFTLGGFVHTHNCGGFCIKAGQAHFLHLLKAFPDRFAYHEAKEQEIRNYLGADVSILRDRRGGVSRPMTLRELRKRHESGDEQLDFLEWGGCGCAF